MDLAALAAAARKARHPPKAPTAHRNGTRNGTADDDDDVIQFDSDDEFGEYALLSMGLAPVRITLYPLCTHSVPTLYPLCTHSVPLCAAKVRLSFLDGEVDSLTSEVEAFRNELAGARSEVRYVSL